MKYPMLRLLLALALLLPLAASGSAAATPTVASIPSLALLAQQPAQIDTLQIVRGPYLQMGSPTSIVVRWRTNTPTTSRVAYGLAPHSLTEVVQHNTTTTEHVVTLSGLAPDTTYFYAVGSTSTTLAGDASHFFVTSPPTGADRPVRIWALGDSGRTGSALRSVRDAYYNFTGDRHTDLWLMLGDNAYQDGTDAEYQSAVFDTFPTMLRKSVLWPTFGNHDGYSASSANQSGPYYDIFSLPTAGQAGGFPSGTEAYYSFDYANIHFVTLDSTELIHTQRDAMLSWLANDLAATQQPWIIAFWHHAPYSRGGHNSDTDLGMRLMRTHALPILEAAGVDLVLGGHSHNYERSFLLDGHYGLSTTLTSAMILDAGSGQPAGDGPYTKLAAPNQGTVYVVNGSAVFINGGSLDHPAIHTVVNARGSMVIDVDNDQLDAIYLDQTGAVRDHFRIVKYTPCYFADVHPNADHSQPGLCDGDVDIADVGRVASCWNQSISATCPASMDIGGTAALIDLYDIAAVAEQWGWRQEN